LEEEGQVKKKNIKKYQKMMKQYLQRVYILKDTQGLRVHLSVVTNKIAS